MGNTQPEIGAVHVMDATDGRRSIKATQSYAGKLQIIGDHSAIIRNSDKVHDILNEAESKISSLGLRVRFTAEELEPKPLIIQMQTEAKTASAHHQAHCDDQQNDTQSVVSVSTTAATTMAASEDEEEDDTTSIRSQLSQV